MKEKLQFLGQVAMLSGIYDLGNEVAIMGPLPFQGRWWVDVVVTSSEHSGGSMHQGRIDRVQECPKD